MVKFDKPIQADADIEKSSGVSRKDGQQYCTRRRHLRTQLFSLYSEHYIREELAYFGDKVALFREAF